MRTQLPPGHTPQPWYRDAISCLHATLGVVVNAAGGDPLETCGLAWQFRYRAGDVRNEEFYWPAEDPSDPVASLAPYHPIRSRWRHASAGQGRTQLADAVAAGRLPIAAVDNYHLPFRPAYQDVHAAHLVVVYRVDAETVHVCDPTPPAYCGPVRNRDFLNSWESVNPSDPQDAFFSSEPIGRRWLDVEVQAPLPPLCRCRVARALRENLAGFHVEPDPQPLSGPGLPESDLAGLAGVEAFAAALSDTAATSGIAAMYVFGWAMQAQAALHGELLRRLGHQWEITELVQAGRRVEQVAHAWTGVRVTCAHTAAHGEPVTDLPRHAARLRRSYEVAVAAVADAVAVLPPGSVAS